MDKYLKGALVSNAASLGFNWVYNMPYLEKLAHEQSLVFQPIDPAKYKRAGKSYLAYPYAKVGDHSAQGDIAKWLYEALKETPDLTKEAYESLIFNRIQPGGSYVGYVEAYGKKLIINQYNQMLKFTSDALEINDDQLVGFIPYLVTKELGLSIDLAWSLAQAFTMISDYYLFYQMFDELFEQLKTKPLKEALKESVSKAPAHYKDVLLIALEQKDSKAFVLEHSGTACHIPHAIPLIYNILAHTSSFKEAVELNTKLGGASCDRGMLIGAVCSNVYDIPSDWVNQTNLT
ncbi:MAG: ADP-ribosylglycohydrolase family protein [Acholeplasmataceae bacterium]